MFLIPQYWYRIWPTPHSWKEFHSAEQGGASECESVVFFPPRQLQNLPRVLNRAIEHKTRPDVSAFMRLKPFISHNEGCAKQLPSSHWLHSALLQRLCQETTQSSAGDPDAGYETLAEFRPFTVNTTHPSPTPKQPFLQGV